MIQFHFHPMHYICVNQASLVSCGVYLGIIGYDLDAFDLEPAKSFLHGTLDLAFSCIKLVFGHPAFPLPIRVIPPPRIL